MKYYGHNEWENRAREAEYKIGGLKTRLEGKDSTIAMMRGTLNAYMNQMMELDRFYVERVRLLHEYNKELTGQLKEMDNKVQELMDKQASLQAKIDTLEKKKEET
jgi:chromosome segregation ATPase